MYQKLTVRLFSFFLFLSSSLFLIVFADFPHLFSLLTNEDQCGRSSTKKEKEKNTRKCRPSFLRLFFEFLSLPSISRIPPIVFLLFSREFHFFEISNNSAIVLDFPLFRAFSHSFHVISRHRMISQNNTFLFSDNIFNKCYI